MSIEKATLLALPLSCYVLRHPDVPEEREPFFQNSTDQASLAEHLGFSDPAGRWDEQDDKDVMLRIIADAINWLDEHDGEEFDGDLVEDYFMAEDRGWE